MPGAPAPLARARGGARPAKARHQETARRTPTYERQKPTSLVFTPHARSAVTCAECGQADHTVQCAWDECAPHLHHCVRDAVGELGQGLDLALLVAGCQEQTSAGPGLTPSRLRAFQLLHHEREETRWVPALPPGQAPRDGGRQRPPRPGCLIPCHPVLPPGRTEPCSSYTFTTVFTTAPGTQKALSLSEKGL